MGPTRTAVFEFVQTHPDGATTKQVCRALGAPAQTIASSLSKLAAYGKIIKDGGARGQPAIWKPKEVHA